MGSTTQSAPATLNLVKGQKVDLTKTNPGLEKVGFGLGWDLQPGVTFDLDAFAFQLDASGKQTGEVVYFNKLSSAGITHSGDNLTGAGDGDDEVITVDLAKLTTGVEKVVIGVNIFNAAPGQNFGQVKAAFCRTFNSVTPDQSITKFDLNEDNSTNTGFILGELYKKDGEWKFNAVGKGLDGNIVQMIEAYTA